MQNLFLNMGYGQNSFKSYQTRIELMYLRVLGTKSQIYIITFGFTRFRE